MEQTKNGGVVIRRGAFGLQIVSHASFVAFSVFVLFLTYGSTFQFEVFFALTLSIIFYVLALHFNNLGLVSVSWLVLGLMFSSSVFFISSFANYLFIALSVLLLIASYETTRFSFVIQPVLKASDKLSQETLEHFHRTLSNHPRSLLQVFALALASSIAVEYLSSGVIVINPLLVGIVVFALLAVIILAAIVLSHGES
jgi:hypothetical protein